MHATMPGPAAIQYVPKAPPAEARCRACGNWLATAPSGTAWVQTRCGNRRYDAGDGPARKCPLYGKTQRVVFSRAG